MGKVQRFGSISRVKPEKLEYYKKLHANPWPQINAMIKECNIENYSIYYHDGRLLHIMNTLEMIMKLTWPKWQQIQKHRDGGMNVFHAWIHIQKMVHGLIWKEFIV